MHKLLICWSHHGDEPTAVTKGQLENADLPISRPRCTQPTARFSHDDECAAATERPLARPRARLEIDTSTSGAHPSSSAEMPFEEHSARRPSSVHAKSAKLRFDRHSHGLFTARGRK
jgi:hypothetical protein